MERDDTAVGKFSGASGGDQRMADADWVKALDTLEQGKLIDHAEAPGAYYTNNYIDVALIKEIANGGE